MDILNRFWSKVKKGDSCWEFTGALRGGYGVLKVAGKNIAAHRLSWKIHYGEIPPNLMVCHKCDNPKCVNPSHLFLGTHSDNMVDAYMKHRVILPVAGMAFQFKKGHYPCNASTSLELALKVKYAISKRGKSSLKQIADTYNVKYQFVRDISCNRILLNK